MSQLKQRGIAESAKKLGWKANADGYWHYPVWDAEGNVIATRAKAFPNTQQAKDKKYYWPDGKPNNPAADWYTPPGTLEAIEAANGVAYLANGEAALLAFHAAGIYNVIATCHGENTVPKNTDVTLQSFRIATLINIPDKDEAGVKAAAKWRDALRDSGIGYQAKQWPDYLPEKSDFNDLWIHVAFDAQAARKALNECQALILPQPAVKTPKPVIHLDFTEGRAKLVSALYEEMNRASLLERKIFQGIWHQAHCPFHEDKNASAGFNVESGVLNCMGECGKSYSPKELAEKLGIDWKGFFQQEGRKSPKKAEIQAFQTALEEMPAKAEMKADTRSYEDVMRDEIMGREMAFEAGQFVGFGFWKAIPLSVLSAVMTLCNGRSKTAVFLGRLMEALLSGKLPSAFTREMAAQATGLSYDIVFRGTFELNHLGFLWIVRGINSIDSIQSKVSPKNPKGGRPQDIFIVELEGSEITCHLLKMLEIYYLEKHAKKAIAMPTSQMASQLGADESQYLTWRDLAKTALQDSANKQAKTAFDIEMFGNGGNWKGWHKALQSERAAPLNFADFADSHDLRSAILTWWISHIRSVNSREELCRLLGCTDPVIDKLMANANLASDKQTKRVEITKLPSTVKAMGFEFNKIQRDLQGKCWKGGFWDTVEKAWIPFDSYADCLDTYSKLSGRISKAYMLVQTPSKQRFMTEDEIQEREEKQAEEQASEVAASQDFTPKTEAEKTTPSQDTPRVAYVYAKWDKHTYAFLYRQLQLLIYCFTAYTLENHCILDRHGKTVHSGKLESLMAFFLEHASKKQLRKVKSFYGKAYDEDVDLAELQALADKRKVALGISESHEWAEIEEPKEDVSQLAIFSMFA